MVFSIAMSAVVRLRPHDPQGRRPGAFDPFQSSVTGSFVAVPSQTATADLGQPVCSLLAMRQVAFSNAAGAIKTEHRKDRSEKKHAPPYKLFHMGHIAVATKVVPYR